MRYFRAKPNPQCPDEVNYIIITDDKMTQFRWSDKAIPGWFDIGYQEMNLIEEGWEEITDTDDAFLELL